MKTLFVILVSAVACGMSATFVAARHMGLLSWQWLAVFAPIWLGASILLAWWGFWMLVSATRTETGRT